MGHQLRVREGDRDIIMWMDRLLIARKERKEGEKTWNKHYSYAKSGV